MMNAEYPSQINETINGITFSSSFDSGNLKSVRREGVGKYVLSISSDWGINGKTTNYRTWFYFSVEGVRDGEPITFVIENMQNQIGLFREGMQPVYRNCHSSQWDRIKYPCQYRLVPEGYFEVTFKHQFSNDATVYFAFFYPWGCEENQNFLQLCQQMSLQIPNIYYDNSILSYSKEGRPINLITITNGVSQIKEEPLGNCFPLTRPQVFKKPHIFVSARVHPGEVPGSFVNNGLMKFLLNAYDPAAQAARDNFAWCIVPIINPDGVYRGHYRTDSLCQNLNRFYLSPSPQDHPTVYAIKEYIMRLNNTERFHAYIDLHAHAGHKGVFIYGNQLPVLGQHATNCIIPRLICFYSEIFDYDACNFTEKNMYAADKGDGLSKEGSGRVAFYKTCGIVHSYTLECNYNTGKVTNILYDETDDDSYKSDQIDENIVLGSVCTSNPKSYFFTIQDYEQVGAGIANAFLDFNHLNPRSRLPSSPFKTLANLRTFLAYNIMKSMHYRFEPYFRKILKFINNKEQLPRVLKAFYDYIYSGQIKDSLQGGPENPAQKPQTRYQKAQELKKEKQQQQQQQQQPQQIQQYQQQPIQPKQLMRRSQYEQAIPVKQYPFSEVDLDVKQQRTVSQGKLRAKSETKGQQQQVAKAQRAFKIKRNVKL